jgi:dipeptidyl aminopeptidase/acylaminoacyl peptidase
MRIAPHGAWESPITPALVTQAGVRFEDAVTEENGSLYWVESRPEEAGRSVVVRRAPDGAVADLTPAGGNTRTRVHEYGGGAYAVADGVLFAVEFSDQRIYRIEPGGEPVPVTPPPEIPAGMRFADMAIGDGWLVCVRETHRAEGEPVNDLVTVPLDATEPPRRIASGNDFYASPRISPDGARLAWLAWDHPNMPWNGTTLWVAALDSSGAIRGEPQRIAGGPSESIYQPAWAPDGTLLFASDRTGWWNVYRADAGGPAPVHLVEGDIGIPQWVFGTSRFAVMDDGALLAIVTSPGGVRLDLVAPDGTVRTVPPPGTSIGPTLAVAGSRAYLVAGSPDRFPELVAVEIPSGDAAVLRTPGRFAVDPAYLSVPEHTTFETPDGPAHAFHYPPTNPDFQAPEGDAPPLLIVGHGGPTAATRATLDPAVQFWTSRGFAVRDCAQAARSLAGRGAADPRRLAIRGGSAGGFTTLAALAFTDVFAAGASYYGVGDLEMLAAHTHKFESRYLDWLVGPLPESQALYRARSPIHSVDGITCPVILLQGLDDRVVPPGQAEMMAEALRRRGIPVAHVTFPGEGHGFRSAENQIRSLEAELSFYGQVFGFTPAGDLDPVVLG